MEQSSLRKRIGCFTVLPTGLIISMAYESRYEQFEAIGPDGYKHRVRFLKAGFLARGDEPELYFFRVVAIEVVLGISGSALGKLQREKRHLSREEKVDLAGLALKERIEVGEKLEAERLYVREEELVRLAQELGLDW